MGETLRSYCLGICDSDSQFCRSSSENYKSLAIIQKSQICLSLFVNSTYDHYQNLQIVVTGELFATLENLCPFGVEDLDDEPKLLKIKHARP